MKWSFLLFSSFLCLQAIAQYPATGNKMRLGWQTTGDGLVYRGAIGDTATLDPSGINNAWMLLDTASGNLYAYRAKAWRLVSGGGGGVTMPFDSVTFNVNETDASERELKYSEEKGYLQYGGLDSVQIPLLPGIWYVRNDTSVTIPKGTVVRATGTLGASGRIKVKHMIANGSIDAMYVLGIAMQDIAVGADGYVMTQGKIRQVNTQAYSEGAVLYADVDTLGGLTQTEPTGSNLKLPIAFVVNSASNGTIAVRVTSGAYMRDLHDAEITSPASNASLYYNAAQGIWRDTGAAVLVADTSAMLTPYLKKADTLSLSNRINTKLNISDTLAMLTNYINVVDTAAMLTNYINIADTATMLSSYISNADTSVFARDFQISGTANYLAKFTGANTVGNSGVFESGGNVGIGTASPGSYLLNLRDSIGFSGNGMYFSSTNGGTANPGGYIIGTKLGIWGTRLDIWLRDAGGSLTERAVSITGGGGYGGSIGINTITPSRPLHVNATSAIRIPVGNLAQRGTSGAGDIRVRSDAPNLEFHNGTSWQTVINNSDTSVFARDVQISGTTNYIPKFTGANTIGNSAIYEINKKILVNSTSSITTFNLPTIELHGNGSNPTTDQPIIAVSANNGNSAISRGYLNLNRSGGTTAGNTTLVPYDYFIGTLRWAATDGIEPRSGAEISAITDSITGLSDMPTALTFATTANGAASTTERMRITSAGNVGIATSSPSRPLHVAGTTAIRIPVGNLAQRGTSGAGDIRVRSDTANLEFHNGTSWQTVATQSYVTDNAISTVYIPINLYAPGDTVANTTNSKAFFLVHSGLNGYCIDSYTVKAFSGSGTADIQIDKNGTGGNLQAISGTTTATKNTNIALATGDYIRGQVFNLSGTLVGLGLTLEIKKTCN